MQQMQSPLADKQMEFILKSTRKWNLAHGSVRSGKTVCTLFRFMQAAMFCPCSQIFMVGYSADTIFENAVRLLLESEQLAIFRPFCTWFSGKRELHFRDKKIKILGAKDEGCIGAFQGKTMALVYCDEITLYPPSIIDMIDSRLSLPYSMGFASMNPTYPSHKVKEWIDYAADGDPNYYALHFSLEDNPFVDQGYKDRLKKSLSGVFYKRNYLGLWCLAEGAIFDFFDRSVHVVNIPPRAAEYFIAGIDYGSSNAFACVVVGVSTGQYTQTGKCLWVEKEYYWDCKKTGRQKTNSEFADDMEEFLEPYGIRNIYIDPSALSMKLELKKRKMHVTDSNNDVLFGIETMTSEMAKGNLFVLKDCPNLIREIESYVWDDKKSSKGEDAPIKKADHACVAGDTLITLLENQITIKELAEGYVEGYFTNYNKIKNEIDTDTFLNPCLTRANAEIWELELENGIILKATPDHQVLTQRGFMPLCELTLSDTIMTCSVNNISEDNST